MTMLLHTACSSFLWSSISIVGRTPLHGVQAVEGGFSLSEVFMLRQFQFEVFRGTDRDLFISQDVPGDDPDLVRISIDQLPALIGALQNLKNELVNQE